MSDNTKQIAINKFTGGLLMDNYPTNLDNNTLTNCLNGTILTYDGHEFMLQTDIGNGRVETAYLPSGYVPIGIKEYGGIIYVASYNPITNKGLIGSFPSPERNFSSTEISDLNNMLGKDNFSLNSKTGIKSFFEKILILGSGNTIKPGDRFALSFNVIPYSDDTEPKEWNWTDLSNTISKFNSNKEKLISLGVAIKDNKGNLQDITNDLLSFNENGEISTPEKGYFLKYNKGTSSDFGTDFDSYNKNVKYLNTYKGNLIGELYLTATINSLKKFEVLFSGEKDSNDNYTLNFILSYEDVFPKENNPYLKYIDFKLGDKKFIIEKDGIDETKQISFSVNSLSKTSGIIKYEFLPSMVYGPLETFRRTGSINLDLLNSGVIELNTWKYFIDVNNMTIYIDWGLNTYLRNSEYVTSVKFIFYEVFGKTALNTEIEKTLNSKKYYNGNFTEKFKLSLPEDIDSEIKLQKIYVVNIQINTNRETTNFYELLYTSNYFNSEYVKNVSNYYSKTLNLNISNEVNLFDNNTIKEEEHNLSTSPLLYTKLPEDRFPFFINMYKSSSRIFNFSVNPILDYEDTLPFTSDFFHFNSKVSTINSKCTIDNLEYVYNNMDLSDKFNDGKINDPIEVKYILDADNVNKYSVNVNNSTISLNLQVVSKYIADTKAVHFETNDGVFKPYMSNNDPEGYASIFGYKTNLLVPTKGIDILYGRVKGTITSAENALRAEGRIVELPDSYSDEQIIDTGIGENFIVNPSNREWSKYLLPEIETAWKNKYNLKAPLILIWIPCTNLAEKDKDLILHNLKVSEKSGETNNYNLVFWKSKDQGYFLLNQFYNKGSYTVDNKKPLNALLGLRRVFNRVYLQSNLRLLSNVYKANNYTYSNNYNVKLLYEGKITGYVKENAFSKTNLTSNTYNVLKMFPHIVNNIHKIINNEVIEKTFLAKCENNFKVTITTSESPIELEHSTEAAKINALALNFELVLFNSNCLLTPDGDIFYEDGNGNAFNGNKMYYIGKDNLPYPIERDEEHFKNSSLNILKVNGVLGFNPLKPFEGGGLIVIPPGGNVAKINKPNITVNLVEILSDINTLVDYFKVDTDSEGRKQIYINANAAKNYTFEDTTVYTKKGIIDLDANTADVYCPAVGDPYNNNLWPLCSFIDKTNGGGNRFTKIVFSNEGLKLKS